MKTIFTTTIVLALCACIPFEDIPQEEMEVETETTTETGETDEEPGFCGDHVVDPLSEVCDGIALNGMDCGTFAFDGGQLICDSDCKGVDISQCFFGEPNLPFTQLLCLDDGGNDGPCFAELSKGMITNAISSCDFDDLGPYEEKEDTIWDVGCAVGEDAGAIFENVKCVQLKNAFNETVENYCYAQILPNWYVEIIPECEIEPFLVNPEPIWEGYPIPEGCSPDSESDGWDYAVCDGVQCFAKKQHHMVSISPFCGLEVPTMDPNEVCLSVEESEGEPGECKWLLEECSILENPLNGGCCQELSCQDKLCQPE